MKIDTQINSNIKKLLDESNESMYWIGFILADGHIDNVKNRLTVATSIKDLDYLKTLSDYLETTLNTYPKKSYCSIACQDQINVSLLAKKYNISNRKTYEPPDISKYELNINQWISLICGFIDGDGCIGHQTGRKAHTIRIKCHSSWKENLSFIEKKLYEILLNIHSEKLTKINNQGYAQVAFSKNLLITKLKEKAISLNIPLMKRKWNKIDTNFISKYDTADKIRNIVIDLHNHGFDTNEIADKLSYSYGGVYRIVRYLS